MNSMKTYLHQVDDCLVSAPSTKAAMSVLEEIGSKVTFKISPDPTKLFYATDIEQTKN